MAGWRGAFITVSDCLVSSFSTVLICSAKRSDTVNKALFVIKQDIILIENLNHEKSIRLVEGEFNSIQIYYSRSAICLLSVTIFAILSIF